MDRLQSDPSPADRLSPSRQSRLGTRWPHFVVGYRRQPARRSAGRRLPARRQRHRRIHERVRVANRLHAGAPGCNGRHDGHVDRQPDRASDDRGRVGPGEATSAAAAADVDRRDEIDDATRRNSAALRPERPRHRHDDRDADTAAVSVRQPDILRQRAQLTRDC